MSAANHSARSSKQHLQLLTLKQVQDALRSSVPDPESGAATDPSSDGPFFEACEEDNWHVVRALLLMGRSPNSCNSDGESALHLASCWGAESVVRGLVEYGADILHRNAEGETALHEAVRGDHVGTVKVLLRLAKQKERMDALREPSSLSGRGASGSSLNIFASERLIDSRDLLGCTALHVAAFNGSVKCVEALLEDGASVRVRDLGGNTPLHAAARGGGGVHKEENESPVALSNSLGGPQLTSVGRARNLERQGRESESLPASGYVQRCEACVELLVRAGADLRCRSYDNLTSLELAEQQQQKLEEQEASRVRAEARRRASRTRAASFASLPVDPEAEEMERRDSVGDLNRSFSSHSMSKAAALEGASVSAASNGKQGMRRSASSRHSLCDQVQSLNLNGNGRAHEDDDDENDDESDRTSVTSGSSHAAAVRALRKAGSNEYLSKGMWG